MTHSLNIPCVGGHRVLYRVQMWVWLLYTVSGDEADLIVRFGKFEFRATGWVTLGYSVLVNLKKGIL